MSIANRATTERDCGHQTRPKYLLVLNGEGKEHLNRYVNRPVSDPTTDAEVKVVPAA